MFDLCLGTLDPLQLVQTDLDDSIPQELTDYTEEDMDKVCPLPLPPSPPSQLRGSPKMCLALWSPIWLCLKQFYQKPFLAIESSPVNKRLRLDSHVPNNVLLGDGVMD